MPQRSLIVRTTQEQEQEPISLRRSPRLLQRKSSSSSSADTKVRQSSLLSLSCSTTRSRSSSRSKNKPQIDGSKKLSLSSSKNDVGSDCQDEFLKEKRKIKCGSESSGKSASGSNLSNRVEGCRRSPRFCNEGNGVGVLAVYCSPKSKRRLKRGGKDVVVCGIGASSPVTPVVARLKADYRVGDPERRITRSCSKLLLGELGNEMNGRRGCKEKGGDRMSGVDVRLRSCVNEKKENVSCGLAGRKERGKKVKGDAMKDSRRDSSCEQKNGEGLRRRVARGDSKQKAEQKKLSEQIVGRQSTRASGRHQATGKRVTGSLHSVRGQQVEKRKTCPSLSSLSSRLEEEAGPRGINENDRECYVAGDKEIVPAMKKERSDTRASCKTLRGARVNQEITVHTKAVVGVKRKRQEAGTQAVDRGWTKEQERALQNAYFVAKPSPFFWKEVAKLVPGKSAQECFDKVHSDNLTPLSTRPASRFKKCDSPSDSPFSGCDFFNFIEKKSKKTSRPKKSHVARRTVRHLLQKFSQVTRDNEADLFSVLEPSVYPSAEISQLNTQSTPTQLNGSPGSSSTFGKGSSGFKKSRSRLSALDKSPLTSPPVLKKVKNMALHEKYIDQLHKREAQRKVSLKRSAKLAPCHKDKENNPAAVKNIIKAAKDALVSDARDAISKFQLSQVNILDEFSDSEELLTLDEDDDEILL